MQHFGDSFMAQQTCRFTALSIKSGLRFVFVKRVLLEHSHSHSFTIDCEYLCMTELRVEKETWCLVKLKIFTTWLISKKACQSLLYNDNLFPCIIKMLVFVTKILRAENKLFNFPKKLLPICKLFIHIKSYKLIYT